MFGKTDINTNFGFNELSANMESASSIPSIQEKNLAGARRNLRILVIGILVLLTAQGWSGDFANLFAVFPTGQIASLNDLFQALFQAGPLVLYHSIEGLVLLALSIAILVFSFAKSRSKNLRIFALLGTISVISAIIGGVLFVLSSFQNNANSAQMGGSFIGAYAFYFLVLYFTK
jgi:hypothetical protein